MWVDERRHSPLSISVDIAEEVFCLKELTKQSLGNLKEVSLSR